MEKLKMKKVSLVKKPPKVKKPNKFVGKGLKIVDEDSFAFGYKPPSDSDDEDVEDLPQIAHVVDERPMEVQLIESFNKGKWKRLDEDDDKRTSQGNGALSLSPRQITSTSDNDISPPRRRDRSLTPRKRASSSSNDDLSPPRKRDRPHNLGSRRRGRSSSRDISPPRRRDRSRDSDKRRKLSPLAKDSDRRRPRASSDDMSPPRRSSKPHRATTGTTHRRDRSADTSPPRRRAAGPSSSRKDSPRRDKRSEANSDADLSPPRKTAKGRVDNSPPRSRRRDPPPRHGETRRRDRNLAQPEIIDDSDSDNRKSKITLDGKKAGLQKARALRDEMLEFRKRENEVFETLPDEVSGRNAVAVKRDRRTEEDFAKEAEKERKEAERKEQYGKWGKGLKQVEEQAERVRSALHEMAKPLARYKDDDDLDDHLKNQDREGDPMLEYLAAKRRKALGAPERPKYSGPPPPPNRFQILPGFRWDGVDRSNGYEKEWFNQINAKKALEEEAYRYLTD